MGLVPHIILVPDVRCPPPIATYYYYYYHVPRQFWSASCITIYLAAEIVVVEYTSTMILSRPWSK